jgi:hypothetical protein
MATYISSGSSNFGNITSADYSLASVTAAVGNTIFVAYNHRFQTSKTGNLTAPPTWNGETFTAVTPVPDIVGDAQHLLDVYYLTTSTAGTYTISAPADPAGTFCVAAYAVYSGVTSFSPIEVGQGWFAAGYTNPSLTVTGTGTILEIFGPSNWGDGFSDYSATTWSPANGQTVRESIQHTAVDSGWAILADIDSTGSQTVGFTPSANQPAYTHMALLISGATGPDYTQRKGSALTATHTLGTITTATLNGVNVFDHVASQAAGTINFTGSVTDERTTSGEVDLVLGDGATTQTQTVQVNVFGVVPSNNPAQKEGSALASLTGIQIRITAGANLNGTQVYYSGTETTNASGNFSTLDVSTSAAVAADPVLMQVLTAAGDSITSAETVGLI